MYKLNAIENLLVYPLRKFKSVLAAIFITVLTSCGGGGGGGGGGGDAGSVVYVQLFTQQTNYAQDSNPNHLFQILSFGGGIVDGYEILISTDGSCTAQFFSGTHDSSNKIDFCISDSAGIDRQGQPDCFSGGGLEQNLLELNGEIYSPPETVDLANCQFFD